jgi:hypothetical protein
MKPCAVSVPCDSRSWTVHISWLPIAVQSTRLMPLSLPVTFWPKPNRSPWRTRLWWGKKPTRPCVVDTRCSVDGAADWAEPVAAPIAPAASAAATATAVVSLWLVMRRPYGRKNGNSSAVRAILDPPNGR